MGEKKLKIIFAVFALIMLLAMILISRDAGISGDEEVHHKHSELVYSYFSSLGADKSALDTPKTHLQYYGQAFDNLVTILIHWLGIDDIYGFRHLMCSLAGWLTIVVTALFAAYISGYGAAILVLLLFAVSPAFLGHSQNNLKDIPFALAYISSIYYSVRLIFAEQKPSKKDILLLVLSIALSVGIRAGGLLVIFYLAFFILLKIVLEWVQEKKTGLLYLKEQLILFAGVAISGYLLGLVLWPYALQNPLLNPWKSHQVMTHFPTTVRQIFEGRFDWSDFHPWYYLPKYMALTIPVIVFSGVILFFPGFRKNYLPNQKMQLGFVGFSIVFPLVFVVLKQSNLYGSWRHFLFVYPGIILIAALGINAFLNRYKNLLVRIPAIAVLLVLSVHPLKFMAANHPYYYLYYNQFTGGLKGAYGNYETDYYYHTMREGAEWLQEYLKNKPTAAPVIVGGNFPCQWYFRGNNTLKFVYFPWQNRSEYNWDYAIVANSYIPPYQLKNKIWPPKNTIHTIFAEEVPVCAIVGRVTKDDLAGIAEQKNGENIKSALLFENALKFDPQNELICYKFAEVLLANGNEDQANKMLARCLEINPDYEKALVMLGDVALKKKEIQKAVVFYERTIQANRKYYIAYTKLARIYAETNVLEARKILKDCLKLNAKYRPALEVLADTYRESDPAIARKYDELIIKLK